MALARLVEIVTFTDSLVGAETVPVTAVLRLGCNVQKLLIFHESVPMVTNGGPCATLAVDISLKKLAKHLKMTALRFRENLNWWRFHNLGGC